MRKILQVGALAGLAVAASADAQVGGPAPSPCDYGVVDTDHFPELARLGEGYRYIA